MSARNRRWLITFCGLLTAVFVTLLVLGGFTLWALLDARDTGDGNRTVSCVNLQQVAPPDVYARVRECPQPPTI